jgi:hypothetical protein
MPICPKELTESRFNLIFYHSAQSKHLRMFPKVELIGEACNWPCAYSPRPYSPIVVVQYGFKGGKDEC